MNLTKRELDAIERQLLAEQTMIKKYRCFSAQFTDAELQSIANQIADRHQKHFNTLMGYLQ